MTAGELNDGNAATSTRPGKRFGEWIAIVVVVAAVVTVGWWRFRSDPFRDGSMHGSVSDLRVPVGSTVGVTVGDLLVDRDATLSNVTVTGPDGLDVVDVRIQIGDEPGRLLGVEQLPHGCAPWGIPFVVGGFPGEFVKPSGVHLDEGRYAIVAYYDFADRGTFDLNAGSATVSYKSGPLTRTESFGLGDGKSLVTVEDEGAWTRRASADDQLTLCDA